MSAPLDNQQQPVTFVDGPAKIAGTSLVIAGDHYPPEICFERIFIQHVALSEWTTALSFTAVGKQIARYQRTDASTPDGRRVYRFHA